ncbi:Os01g0100466 [Oryza sativa Japonica Group]|uniref:Os01g0100466 protein n=1 Tax=Oryza sativa subsp. japonica TaxID=39947 RepID=A0A0P0UXH5_ORYSJ|nr:hypothetical protein EE612_000006 [Oryza sativa]BAS69912.1 Os01g0100466 [Oryza sativa Japonica Group]
MPQFVPPTPSCQGLLRCCTPCHVSSSGSSRPFLTFTTRFQLVVTFSAGPGSCPLMPIASCFFTPPSGAPHTYDTSHS